MDNLRLVEMNSLPDDVDIHVTKYQPNLFDLPGMSGLHTIYEDVKRLAVAIVETCHGSEDPRRFTVEMVRNLDGYPTAYTWYEGRLVSKLGVIDGSLQGDEGQRMEAAHEYL